MNFDIKVRDTATPRVNRLLDSLTPAGLVRMHQRIGRKILNLTRNYFLGLQSTRHATAERLGAQPTNYWGKAAESVSQPENLSTDAESARLLISAPGISRAMQDIDIFPGDGKQYLTIPIASESYGNRILMGEDTPRFENGFFFTSKAGNLLYAQRQGQGKEATIHPLYLLKPSVHQEQDRTLLPSDEAYLAAAMAGVRVGLDDLAGERGLGGAIAEKEGA